MGKAPTAAKWLLNITLVLMLLVMASYGVQAFKDVGREGERMIMLPVSFMAGAVDDGPAASAGSDTDSAPDSAGFTLAMDSETLGRGFVVEADGTAIFTVPSSSAACIMYYVGTLLALVPGLALVVLLRKIVVSVSRGEPFSASNIGRIRAIGAITIAAELVRGLGVLGIQAWLAKSAQYDFWMTVDVEWNLVIFVLGVVILALAEVFSYGTQLQSDADLTV